MAKTLVSQSNIREIIVREPLVLTTSYVSSESFKIQGANQLQLLVSFTQGSSDGCKLLIEFSQDEVNWFQESAIGLADVSGVKEVTHTPAIRKIESSSDIVVSVPISASFFRVSAVAITSGAGTSLSIVATIANI